MNLMDLVATLKLNADEYLRGIDQAMSGFDQFKKQFDDANKGFEAWASTAISAGAALTAGLTIPIVGTGAAALSMASDFEQAEIAFTTMLGSAKESKVFLNELKAFAASTPFEFPELQDAAKKMMALGFESQTVIPIMRTIGDAVAGLGGNSALIDRITLQLGQMQAKGKVAASEMKTLAEAGIPAWQLLADKIGVSVPDAMKMAEKGAISAAEAIPAILEGMTEKFGGMMAKQSQTAAGQFSNMKDQITFILADLGKALLPFATMVLEFAKPMLEAVKFLVDGFAALPMPIQSVVVGLAALAAAIGPVLVAMGLFTQGILAIGPLLGTTGLAATLSALGGILGPIALAVAAVAAAWGLWQLEPVQSALKSVWDTLTGLYDTTLKPFLSALADGATAFTTFAASVISSGLQAALEAISTAGLALWEQVTKLWDAFTSLLGSLSPLIDLLMELGELLAKLYVVMLAKEFEILASVLGFVWDLIVKVASVVGGALWEGFKNQVDVAKQLSEVLGNFLKPVIETVSTKISEFIGWLSKIPGVSDALKSASSTFDSIKASIASAVEPTAQVVSSMQLARKEFEDANKVFLETEKRFKEGKASSEEYKIATEKMMEAKKNLNAELKIFEPAIKASGKAVADARKEYAEANKNLAEVSKKFGEGKASAGEYVAAQGRVKDASDKLNSALKNQKDVMVQAEGESKKYSGSLRDVRESLERGTKATGLSAEETKKLEAEHKKIETAVRNTSTALQGILTHLDRTKGSVGDLASAQQKIQDLQAKLTQQYGTDMPAAIKGMYVQLEIAKTRVEELKSAAEKLELERLFEAATAAVQKHTENLRTFVRDHSDLLATATASSLRQVNAAMEETRKADEEFKRIHGASKQELERRATQAEQDYARIAQAANHTNAQIDAAEREMLRSRIALHEAAGKAVAQSDRDRLKELEGNLKGHTEKAKTMWDVLANQVSTIFTDLSKDLTDRFFKIVSGEGGWAGMKANALGVLEDIGKAVTRFGLETLEAYFMDQLKKITKELLPDLKDIFTNIFTQNGGVWKAVTGLFDHIGDLFKKTKDAIIGVRQEGLNQLAGWGIGGTGTVAGAAGSAGTGAGSAGGAGAAAGSGLAGVVGAIGSVASAISGIVGNFQMAGMNKSLDLIEESTRYVKIDTQTIVNLFNRYLPKLEGFENFNYNVVAPSWFDLLSHLDTYMPRFATAWETDIPGDIDLLRTSVENAKGTIENMRDTLAEKLAGLVSGFGDKLAAVSAGFKTAIDLSTSSLQSTLREIVNSDTTSRTSITSALSMLGGDVRNVQNAIFQTNMSGAMLSELGMIRGELTQIKSLSQNQLSAKPSQVIVNVQAPAGTASPQNFGYVAASALKSQFGTFF